MKKMINVAKGQYAIVTPRDINKTLQAISLNGDIAIKFLAQGPHTKVGGVARSPSIEQVREIFDPAKLGQPKKILVQIVGGDSSEAAHGYFSALFNTLKQIDGGSGVFNITCTVNNDIHPNFCLLSGEELNYY